jgi:stalled ribosome rescue protein Dom34
MLWRVYSCVVKPEKTVWLEENWSDQKAVYNFFERTIDVLRPAFREGVRSVILVSSGGTSYAQRFMGHVRLHHRWLVRGPNKATFSQMTGSAGTLADVAEIAKTPVFHSLITETTSQETRDLVDLIEEYLNDMDRKMTVSYTLEEAEELIVGSSSSGRLKPEYLLLTDEYLSGTRERGRVNRVMQIAVNRKVRTRVVDVATPAGIRLTQLGGMVVLAKRE